MKKGKNSIHAQSGIITTVLIILLILVAIIIVWQVIKKNILIGTEKIEITAFTTQLEIQTAKLWVTGGAEITVKKSGSKEEVDSIKFIFEEQDGETKVIERKKENGYEMPNELETKIYYFNASEINDKIERVGVVPVFGKNMGLEVYKDNPLKNEVNASSGLISWWKFDGDAKDEKGINNGSFIDNAAIVNDVIRESVLGLDGNTAYVIINDDNSLDVSKLTISAWVNFADFSSSVDDSPIVIKRDFGRTDWQFIFRPEESDLGYYGGGAISGFDSGNRISTLNTWYHVAITYGSGEVTYYVNGAAGDTDSGVTIGEDQTQNIRIGSFDNSGIGNSFDLNGAIDDVMIFNRSLSAEEITAIYNNQKM